MCLSNISYIPALLLSVWCSSHPLYYHQSVISWSGCVFSLHHPTVPSNLLNKLVYWCNEGACMYGAIYTHVDRKKDQPKLKKTLLVLYFYWSLSYTTLRISVAALLTCDLIVFHMWTCDISRHHPVEKLIWRSLVLKTISAINISCTIPTPML